MLNSIDPRFSRLGLRTVLRTLADFVMPRECVVCGRGLLPSEDAACVVCLSDLPLTYFWLRPRNPMADAFNARIEADSYCFAAALFYYGDESRYQNITRSLKYYRNFSSGRRFSRMLGEKLKERGSPLSDVDCVVPVPLHWTRRISRGYNQAEIIAREIAAELGVPCRSLLRRVRRTRSQARLSVGSKASNMSGAFRAARDESSAGPRHILIVDDVFTTGSTLAECYRALHSAFGDRVRISIATLSFVGHI